MKILIEGRCAAHVERVNNNRNIVELLIGDIHMVRTDGQGDVFKNKVDKLRYKIRGPLRIVQCIPQGIYSVIKLYKPDSSNLKFIATDLYFLPHSFKSCEPVDSSNIGYLNQLYSPITNSLRKGLINISNI